MKRIIFIILFTFFLCLKGNAQIKNEREFLNFAKTEFNSKQKFLLQNNWSVITPRKVSVDEKGIKNEFTIYKKSYNGKMYKLSIEKSSSQGSTVDVFMTTVILPNGTIFDTWIDGFETLGYNFIKAKDVNGKLFAGERGLMISAEIENIDETSSNWVYVISVMTDKKKNN